MAARIVIDACDDRFDRMMLITADSDIKPAIDILKARFPEKQVFVVAPPGRMGHARGINPAYQLIARTAGKASAAGDSDG